MANIWFKFTNISEEIQLPSSGSLSSIISDHFSVVYYFCPLMTVVAYFTKKFGKGLPNYMANIWFKFTKISEEYTASIIRVVN